MESKLLQKKGSLWLLPFLLPGIGFTAFLFILSLFRTVSCRVDAYLGEYTFTALDNGFLNILMLVIVICLTYLLHFCLDHFRLRPFLLVLCLWTIGFGFCFVYSASRVPGGDAEIIASTAYLAAKGNFTAMADYLNAHPFRIGLAFYEEVYFRLLLELFPDISRGYCFMSLELLNVLFLGLSYWGLVELCGSLYHSEPAQKLTAVLLMLFVPAILRCTSVNGAIPSFSLSVLGLCAFARFLEKPGLRSLLAGALCMGLALSMKVDAALVLLAILLIWLLWALRGRRLKGLLALLLYLALVAAVELMPVFLCEQRAQTDYGDGDLNVRTVMGLDEMENGSLRYAGMYTAASEEIASSASRSRQEAREVSNFDSFSRLWNEPSFHSLYINQSCQHYRETGPLYKLLCEQDSWLLLRCLDMFQSFLLAGALLAALLLLWERELGKCLPLLVLLLGLLFHLFFPADSRYALKFYLLLVPLAAFAYSRAFAHYEKKRKA